MDLVMVGAASCRVSAGDGSCGVEAKSRRVSMSMHHTEIKSIRNFPVLSSSEGIYSKRFHFSQTVIYFLVKKCLL